MFNEKAINQQALNQVIQAAATLSVDEQLQLAQYLIQQARQKHPPESPPQILWSQFYGLAKPPCEPVDAQQRVDRFRADRDIP